MAEQEVGQKGKTYGLLLPKKGQSKLQIKSVFGDDSDDETPHEAVNTSLQKEAEKLKIKRKTQLEIDKALEADPTVYEYDSIYDSIQEKKDQQVSANSSKVKVDKKPKYIEGLLKASEKRKKEYERQQERTVQKEREKEGNEFADKEVFVTSSYRKKMQEMQEAEEEERRQAEMEAILDVKNQKDMTGFYRYLLKEKTGENVKAEKTEDKVKENIKTEKEDHSGDDENRKTDNTNKDQPNKEEEIEDKKPVIKKDQTENKERRQYRPRRSSSSSSRSSSGSRSPSRRPSQKKSKASTSPSENEDSADEKERKRSKSSDKKMSNDKQISKSKESKSKKDISGKTDIDQKVDKKGKRSRSSSPSNSEEETLSKKRKSDEKGEKKTEKKYDRELTIEEIKARYARWTTPEMIETARERYFIRKMERDLTKPYIFKSDE